MESYGEMVMKTVRLLAAGVVMVAALAVLGTNPIHAGTGTGSCILTSDDEQACVSDSGGIYVGHVCEGTHCTTCRSATNIVCTTPKVDLNHHRDDGEGQT